MSMLTVFTPTYNRAHTIGRTYKSLCAQTCTNFEWLVIDDGSSDNTRRMIKSWIKDPITEGDDSFWGYSKDAIWLKITYIYQKNQGMHGAHNTAYAHISTELNTCIDSDDYMPSMAVENILGFWNSLSIKEKKSYAGIMGLDIDDKDKKIIGTPFPEDLKSTTTIAYYGQGGKGDKKLVYRTDIIKQIPPYPIFEGEKYVGLN